eukprot:TRINITY_DN4681_c0_g2_i1.p1 TRINITY_DN4681_c0_g2~~TRINITY_DN4681_c0_g2_i1.p1  ORF type:complete len:159 (+),score=42.53 TRINITY_DN4681_c0_g2_i1:209-685(+)
MLELMGLELNIYQRAELNAMIAKSREFKVNALKLWLFKNRNFILCRLAGKDLKKRAESPGEKESTLPGIKDRSRSTGRVHANPHSDYYKLAKRNKEIMQGFTQQIENLYKRSEDAVQVSRVKKILERLNKTMKEQRNTYAKNIELLSLIRKYSNEMNQ